MTLITPKELDAKLRKLALHQAQAERLTNEIKLAVDEYYRATGDRDINPYITIVQFPDKPMYDRKEAEKWAMENMTTLREDFFEQKTVFRTKAFNDALRDGKVEWDGAELVNDYRIDISTKLGALLPEKES